MTRRSDERGFAMVAAILFGVVLMAVVIVTSTTVQRSMSASTKHVEFEREIYLAETGIDQGLARLQKDPSWATTTATAADPNATPAQEEAWARAELEAAPLVAADGGEYAIVRADNVHAVYAAGWSPSRAHASRTRVLKAEYVFSTYSPANAVLSNGALKIGGNAAVTGQLGNVHANGDITVVGGSLTVSGTLTATGSVTGGQPQWLGSQAPQEVPQVDPRSMYDRFATKSDMTDWYDLCPDGTVRSPSGSGPCSGTVLSSSGTFRGWQFSGGDWRNDRDPYDGVYYVYQGSARIRSTGTLWRATIITEPTGTDGALLTGDIEMQGKPYIIGYLPDIALVAGRDLDIEGTGSGDGSYEGLLGAHEQFEVTGNPTVAGALVAEGSPDSAGSPVSVDYVSGSMIIKHDQGLEADLGGLIRTTLWLEL